MFAAAEQSGLRPDCDDTVHGGTSLVQAGRYRVEKWENTTGAPGQKAQHTSKSKLGSVDTNWETMSRKQIEEALTKESGPPAPTHRVSDQGH